MSLKKRKKQILSDFKEFCLEELIAKDKEGLIHREEADPWEDGKCFDEIRILPKTIVRCFIDGLIEAQRWNSNLFEAPQGFADVLKSVGRDVQYLQLGFKDGKIRMTINDLVSRHMRNWIKDSDIIQKWIKDDILTARAVMRNACVALMLDRDAFENEFNDTLGPMAAKQMHDVLAEARAESGIVNDSSPATPSSDFLKAVEVIPANDNKKGPATSGLQPSV